MTAHAPARLLQGVFVDLAVFHDQLEVVLVIHHHFDVFQRIALEYQQVSISTGLNDAQCTVQIGAAFPDMANSWPLLPVICCNCSMFVKYVARYANSSNLLAEAWRYDKCCDLSQRCL